MPSTTYKNIVVYFQTKDPYAGNACRGGTCFSTNKVIGVGHLSFRALITVQKQGRFQYRWVHWHWSCVTGLQIGGIREILTGGERTGEYNWSLFLGLIHLPANVQELVKEAVRKGAIDLEHKAENIRCDPPAELLKNVSHEAEVADDVGSKSALKEDNSPANTAVKLAFLTRNDAAKLAGVAVCYGCQSNDHWQRDCPKSMANCEMADRAAFLQAPTGQQDVVQLQDVSNVNRTVKKFLGGKPRAWMVDDAADKSWTPPPVVAPQFGRTPLPRTRPGRPSQDAPGCDENDEPQENARVSILAQPKSLFNLPSDYRKQAEMSAAERAKADFLPGAPVVVHLPTSDPPPSPPSPRPVGSYYNRDFNIAAAQQADASAKHKRPVRRGVGARLSAIKKYNEREAARLDVKVAPKTLKVKLEDETPDKFIKEE